MFPVIVFFVNKYAILYAPGIHPTLNVPPAWSSLTLCYHISLCLLFKTDAGTLEFITTDLLSQYTSSGPSRVALNVLSLYLSDSTILVAILNATNSEPKLYY